MSRLALENGDPSQQGLRLVARVNKLRALRRQSGYSRERNKRENNSVKPAQKRHGTNEVAPKRSRDDERRMDRLIDELCGCLIEGDALAELEREHRAEVLADERRRP